MALSGISVPARLARIPFYASVLADIGDHQSLAANLSTFTSHVANIARMIELCEAPALVLLDEVGTGTDPEEGSALGVAVVDHFRRACGAHVIATTHYSGLKMYAGNEPGVVNASVEFDEKTLRPTYRLLVGVAGASSGLEIARRFGVPTGIVENAMRSVKDSSLQASEYLRRIKREAENAEELRHALEEERSAVAEKFASLDKEAAKREQERQSTFEQTVQRTIAEVEKRARELVAKIEDRAERVRIERDEAQRVAGSSCPKRETNGRTRAR
jgi:DNA mismatch repair protein MutS2